MIKEAVAPKEGMAAAALLAKAKSVLLGQPVEMAGHRMEMMKAIMVPKIKGKIRSLRKGNRLEEAKSLTVTNGMAKMTRTSKSGGIVKGKMNLMMAEILKTHRMHAMLWITGTVLVGRFLSEAGVSNG